MTLELFKNDTNDEYFFGGNDFIFHIPSYTQSNLNEEYIIKKVNGDLSKVFKRVIHMGDIPNFEFQVNHGQTIRDFPDFSSVTINEESLNGLLKCIYRRMYNTFYRKPLSVLEGDIFSNMMASLTSEKFPIRVRIDDAEVDEPNHIERFQEKLQVFEQESMFEPSNLETLKSFLEEFIKLNLANLCIIITQKSLITIYSYFDLWCTYKRKGKNTLKKDIMDDFFGVGQTDKLFTPIKVLRILIDNKKTIETELKTNILNVEVIYRMYLENKKIDKEEVKLDIFNFVFVYFISKVSGNPLEESNVKATQESEDGTKYSLNILFRMLLFFITDQFVKSYKNCYQEVTRNGEEKYSSQNIIDLHNDLIFYYNLGFHHIGHMEELILNTDSNSFGERLINYTRENDDSNCFLLTDRMIQRIPRVASASPQSMGIGSPGSFEFGSDDESATPPRSPTSTVETKPREVVAPEAAAAAASSSSSPASPTSAAAATVEERKGEAAAASPESTAAFIARKANEAGLTDLQATTTTTTTTTEENNGTGAESPTLREVGSPVQADAALERLEDDEKIAAIKKINSLKGLKNFLIDQEIEKDNGFTEGDVGQTEEFVSISKEHKALADLIATYNDRFKVTDKPKTRVFRLSTK